MTRRDDWSGAIVRLRDGRLCRVEDGRRLTLRLHAENDQILDVHRSVVTMVRPPIGYKPLGLLARETRAERISRTGPWWAGLVGLLALLVACGLVVYALSTGAL